MRMCRWGCPTTNTTYQCKWCGTRYCKECLRGEFTGEMKESTECRKCRQKKCQGQRVEFVARQPQENQTDNEKGKGGVSTKGRNSSPSNKRKAETSGKKKAGGKKSGKKAGKKGGKKKKKKK
ncbi:uncharacterized protein LOC121385281 [Gigantopelta aegis]|uniref:uncharacterized protein LOC121385281 n=1 Tax=Gigantopelta aegis TaxID=1735272 RepID=UPI001B889546|nr:uncharacterized protein LOC121385281 [Gigantopelta aegis]